MAHKHRPITAEMREGAELVRAGFTIRETSKQTGIAQSTLRKYLESLKSEGSRCTCAEPSVTMENDNVCYVCGGDAESSL